MLAGGADSIAGNAPSPRAAAVESLPRAKALQHGPSRGRRIALTFDADLTSEDLRAGRPKRSFYDRDIVRTLRRTDTTRRRRSLSPDSGRGSIRTRRESSRRRAFSSSQTTPTPIAPGPGTATGCRGSAATRRSAGRYLVPRSCCAGLRGSARSGSAFPASATTPAICASSPEAASRPSTESPPVTHTRKTQTRSSRRWCAKRDPGGSSSSTCMAARTRRPPLRRSRGSSASSADVATGSSPFRSSSAGTTRGTTRRLELVYNLEVSTTYCVFMFRAHAGSCSDSGE